MMPPDMIAKIFDRLGSVDAKIDRLLQQHGDITETQKRHGSDLDSLKNFRTRILAIAATAMVAVQVAWTAGSALVKWLVKSGSTG